MTPDQVIEFLQEKAGRAQCEVCGKDEWLVDPGVFSISARVALENGVKIPAIIVACSNCGNMKLFSSYVVERWLNDKI
jgi:hypothetical protein